MVGIVYATRREADPFLSRALAEPLGTRPFPMFQTGAPIHAPCIVIISGMGKVAATMAATHLVLAHRVSVLVSAGLCGRLTMDKDRDVGDLFCIRTAVEGDCDRFGRGEPAIACDTRWFCELDPARLVTCDRPVFDVDRRAQLAGIGELADMEGAAVARVARIYDISCAMVKGISDVADETGRTDLARHIDWVSGRIAEALVRDLAQNSNDTIHET